MINQTNRSSILLRRESRGNRIHFSGTTHGRRMVIRFPTCLPRVSRKTIITRPSHRQPGQSMINQTNRSSILLRRESRGNGIHFSGTTHGRRMVMRFPACLPRVSEGWVSLEVSLAIDLTSQLESGLKAKQWILEITIILYLCIKYWFFKS
ncbi:hypothetical protein CDAR_22111 [Caerostris darwini]|uniref:Uncharacterized protein n=1 Tax=Caerostris darwini TaxID=1538125 RepID=A0AAV4P965_9ARAC|nr:hypothetical protein CDAR_22111 [Caerostris darwini]